MRNILILRKVMNVPSPEPSFPRIQLQTPPRTNVPIPSARLFPAGEREVLIVHAGEHYRLRLTRNGKLILTK